MDYLTVMCFAVAMSPRCVTERLPPPRNLSYVWIDPFKINMTWQADPFNLSCLLKCKIYSWHGVNKSVINYTKICPFSQILSVKGRGRDWRYTVKHYIDRGSCGHYEDSKEDSLVLPPQGTLVTDFKFFLYPPCDEHSTPMPFCGMQTTWIPANGTSELQIFYRSDTNLSSCEVFKTEGLGQGCHLKHLKPTENAYIVFRGMVDGRAENQTFIKDPTLNVRTLQPKVNVTEQGHYLNVSWLHAIVSDKSCWTYIVKYTKCNRPTKHTTTSFGEDGSFGEGHPHSVLVPFDKDCKYEIQVKPQFESHCGSASGGDSPLLVYNDGATRDQSIFVAVLAIPGILSVLVVLLCFYVRRKRKTFFENIPVPPSLLKEMMSGVHQQQQLFVPTREEVEVCSICPAVEVNPLMWDVK